MTANKYQIRFLQIAEEDFSEIIEYIALDNPLAADHLASEIENKLILLSENPMMGRVPRDEDIKNLKYRYIIIENYLIFYTIEGKVILIHRIIHGARNYKKLL